jgi:hypothetical protein
LLLALGCCCAEEAASLVERNPALVPTAAGGSGMVGFGSLHMPLLKMGWHHSQDTSKELRWRVAWAG